MAAATVLAEGDASSILAGQVLLRSPHGYACCLNLLDLLLLTGKLTEPGCGFAPLGGRKQRSRRRRNGSRGGISAGRS